MRNLTLELVDKFSKFIQSNYNTSISFDFIKSDYSPKYNRMKVVLSDTRFVEDIEIYFSPEFYEITNNYFSQFDIKIHWSGKYGYVAR